MTLVFFLIRVSGDPASLGVNLDPNLDREEIEAEYQEIRRKMGLDKPLYIQYLVFWQRTLQKVAPIQNLSLYELMNDSATYLSNHVLWG